MRRWFICSGPDWYRPSITSTKQFARQFHKHGYHVLWINPVAFKSPFVNSANRASAWRKIRNKVATHLRFLRRDNHGFWVWVPLYLPAFGRCAATLNNALFRFQFRVLCILLRISVHESILWISGSFTALGILPRPFACKVYQAADLISGFRDASESLKKALEERESELCIGADLRFAASEKIAAALEALGGRKVYLLHHGVDFDHFSSAGGVHPDMEAIRSRDRPVAGYFGSLSDANDKEALLALADAGFSVVLIGKALGDYASLEAHHNVYFTGPIAYEILPSYARGFDVALLNWRPGEWIDNCFPVKALEYLAVGLPVVSCPIPVLQQHFSDVIVFARSPVEFVDECSRVLREDSETVRRIRRERVRNCSWDNRYRFVKELIDECRISPD